MDLGRDVVTQALIGNTEAEKVFTPWWISLQHYMVYFLVVLGKNFSISSLFFKKKSLFLGLIAVPLNSMMGNNGNCYYKYDSPTNYLLPHKICRLENDTIVAMKKYASHLK